MPGRRKKAQADEAAHHARKEENGGNGEPGVARQQECNAHERHARRLALEERSIAFAAFLRHQATLVAAATRVRAQPATLLKQSTFAVTTSTPAHGMPGPAHKHNCQRADDGQSSLQQSPSEPFGNASVCKRCRSRISSSLGELQLTSISLIRAGKSTGTRSSVCGAGNRLTVTWCQENDRTCAARSPVRPSVDADARLRAVPTWDPPRQSSGPTRPRRPGALTELRHAPCSDRNTCMTRCSESRRRKAWRPAMPRHRRRRDPPPCLSRGVALAPARLLRRGVQGPHAGSSPDLALPRRGSACAPLSRCPPGTAGHRTGRPRRKRHLHDCLATPTALAPLGATLPSGIAPTGDAEAALAIGLGT